MSHRRPWLLAALALALLLPGSAGACGLGSAAVPCGYIYPRLLFELGERGQRYTLTSAAPLHIEGTLTFTWDISAEGLAIQNPTVPIEVSFSFPRKPDWLGVAVEPERLPIPISPEHVEATPVAGGVQFVYNYTAPITVRAWLNGTPVVDPERAPSLLILAQSSESGLYKPGFGVRDLALDLPEALVQTASQERGAQLRIGDAEPLRLEPLALEFEGATLTLQAEGPLELWKPARLTAAVQGAASPAAIDMAASVVDEANAILYTTGLRQRPDAALPFTFTFPAPGHYRVLVAARPLPGSDLGFEPVVAAFDLVFPGVGYDAVRYPDAYRAEYLEPASEFHANTNDLPRQYEKLLRFPVLAGADSASVQLQLGASGAAALGAGSIYAEVLGPADEQVAYGKLDAITPTMDARLKGPLPPGEYKVHLYGTGANPLALGGSELAATLGVFYPEAPVGVVTARGTPRTLAGGAIPLGTGGMELELVLHQDPALWTPMAAMLVAKDQAGRAALHPDFILTVRGPGGEVLYTTGHRHPHDGLLHWGFAFPRPGLYTVSAYAGPTPEASGAFWQPAIASWPIRLEAPADGLVRYPARYEATYMDSTSTVRVGSYVDGYAFDKRYPVPILPGATGLAAKLELMTMAMVEHVEGLAPASLTLQLLGPDEQPLGAAQAAGVGGTEVATAELAAPGTYWVRVYGVGYAPLDYSGAMYNLTITADYPEGPVERLDGASSAPSATPPRGLPGFEVAGVLGALACLALRGRRRA